MARMIVGVLCGLAVAGLALAGCWYGGAQAHPLPALMDLRNAALLQLYAARMPGVAMAWLLAGWALAGFMGGWTAAKISKSHGGPAALVIGAVITAAVIHYATLVPHSPWITVVGLLLPLPAATLAALLAMPWHVADACTEPALSA